MSKMRHKSVFLKSLFSLTGRRLAPRRQRPGDHLRNGLWRRRPQGRIVLEIEIGERDAVCVLDDEELAAGFVLTCIAPRLDRAARECVVAAGFPASNNVNRNEKDMSAIGASLTSCVTERAFAPHAQMDAQFSFEFHSEPLF
ncbi:hypothetical protein [Methylocystis sp.]|uniref:hypothetical protein n=1 Tax=Methylocystis sp. TaxID=1911079 RepID=UPI0025FC6CC5|nr:hypothetical protein [Methylocystis sp.]